MQEQVSTSEMMQARHLCLLLMKIVTTESSTYWKQQVNRKTPYFKNIPKYTYRFLVRCTYLVIFFIQQNFLNSLLRSSSAFSGAHYWGVLPTESFFSDNPECPSYNKWLIFLISHVWALIILVCIQIFFLFSKCLAKHIFTRHFVLEISGSRIYEDVCK